MRLIVPQRWPTLKGIRGLGDDDGSTVDLTYPGYTVDTPYDPTDISTILNGINSGDGGAAIPGLNTQTNLNPSGSSASSGLTATQIASILGTAANTATSVYKATESPYLIPGTNILANPGGTPIVGANSAALTTSSLSSISPLLIVLVIGGVLLMSMGGKK